MSDIDSRYETLRVAMRKIAWPMMALREFAEDQGHDLEPIMARHLAKDANYLKGIAQQAMADIAKIDGAGTMDRPTGPTLVPFDDGWSPSV